MIPAAGMPLDSTPPFRYNSGVACYAYALWNNPC